MALPATGGFPRLYVAASLKRPRRDAINHLDMGFPRLYVAASLKLPSVRAEELHVGEFSAALCRGLIEAPRLAAGRYWLAAVFRGFMSRPH